MIKRILLVLTATVAMGAGAVQPTAAQIPQPSNESQLTIAFNKVDCDTFAVQVGWVDVVDRPTDKRIFVEINDVPEPVVELTDTDAPVLESDPAAWSEQVAAGKRVEARLFSVVEGPDDLIDFDQVTLPDETCADLVIIKDTDPETSDVSFRFTGDLGLFILKDDGEKAFADLEPDSYLITEDATTGFQIADVDCTGAAVVEHFGLRSFEVTLKDNASASCVVHNDAVATPTPTATAAPAPTATATAQPLPTAPVEQPNINVNVVVEAPPVVQTPPPLVTLPVGVTRISPPSTGDGGLLDACSNGWLYIPHYRLVTHYDEYGSYQTFEFWYWEARRCTQWA